jgi:flavin-dependent dehydrogenase
MRVKKRVKRGVKKGIKKVKSAPPEDYLAGAGVLVGGAAMLLLATTKRGHELLIRTAQLAFRQEPDEQESGDSDLSEADEQERQDSDLSEADEQERQDSDLSEADEQERQDSDP